MLGLGVVLVAGGFVWGGIVARDIATLELEVIEGPGSIISRDGTPHVELARAELREGDDVVFEICTEDALDANEWAGRIEFIIWVPDSETVIVRAPMDESLLEGARRSAAGSCITLGSGESLPIAGTYAIEAVWGESAPPPAPFIARILASRSLTTSATYPILLMLLGGLLIIAAGLRKRSASDTEEPFDPRTLLWPALAFGLLVAAMFVAPTLGLDPLMTAGLIAVVQAGASVAFLRRMDLLAFEAPKRKTIAAVALAPIAAIALVYLGGVVRNLVPATGVSPIETFISWPSGSVIVAVVGITVPLAEELFFRGFLYGVLARYSTLIAVVATSIIFALFHLPQNWGAWGNLAAVAMLGTVLTLVRWRTGSSTVPMLIHLVHNGALIGLSFWAHVA